ncbi:helix-turn-helix domain-containing protein [Nibrella saemangeumensis]|uniref:helix-turn-helix domain-containing protein n=1 Tax=Nibrella saemangeumensis TaxID=1084526 RepID=UPI0031EBDA27
MKQDTKKIAPLSPRELNVHHFGGEGQMPMADFHHLFHINRIEDVSKKIRFPLQPHRKTVYDFLFLTEGHTIRSKGLHQYEFSGNTFFFLPALQISTHEYLSPDAKGFFCHFDGMIFNKLFPNTPFYEEFSFWHFSGDPLVQISDSLQQPVLNILNRLLTEYEPTQSLNTNLITAYLLTLFTELSLVRKARGPMAQNAAVRVTEKYKNLLSQHIYQTHKVTEYASMLAVTPDHLNKCVKATIGKTSQELLADMIVLEAKVLLRQTPLSISEIAFKFSETNPSDFTRFFKAKTGLTPKEFRQQAD